jgi:hypothetical protein
MRGKDELFQQGSFSIDDGQVMRVNSTNVPDEGLRIGGVGRRMNSKVKSVEQDVY